MERRGLYIECFRHLASSYQGLCPPSLPRILALPYWGWFSFLVLPTSVSARSGDPPRADHLLLGEELHAPDASVSRSPGSTRPAGCLLASSAEYLRSRGQPGEQRPAPNPLGPQDAHPAGSRG